MRLDKYRSDTNDTQNNQGPLNPKQGLASYQKSFASFQDDSSPHAKELDVQPESNALKALEDSLSMKVAETLNEGLTRKSWVYEDGQPHPAALRLNQLSQQDIENQVATVAETVTDEETTEATNVVTHPAMERFLQESEQLKSLVESIDAKVNSIEDTYVPSDELDETLAAFQEENEAINTIVETLDQDVLEIENTPVVEEKAPIVDETVQETYEVDDSNDLQAEAIIETDVAQDGVEPVHANPVVKTGRSVDDEANLDEWDHLVDTLSTRVVDRLSSYLANHTNSKDVADEEILEENRSLSQQVRDLLEEKAEMQVELDSKNVELMRFKPAFGNFYTRK